MGSTWWSPARVGSPVRRALAVVAVLAVVVLATGCLNGDVDVKVNDDGSGQVVVEIIPARSLQKGLEDLPFEIEELFDGAFTGVDGYEFEEFESDDRTGYRLTVPFDDYRDLQQALLDGGTFGGEQIRLFSSLSIVELPDDAGWQLDAQVLPIAQALTSISPDQVPGNLEELLDASGVGSAGNGLDLTVSLPGSVVSSNAKSTDGGSATWQLDDPDAPVTLNMRTEPTEFPTPVQMVVGGAGLAILLGVGLFVLSAVKPHKSTKEPRRPRQRRRRRGDTSSTGWEAPPPGTAPTEASARPEPLPAMAPLAALSDDTPAPPAEAPAAPAPTAQAPTAPAESDAGPLPSAAAPPQQDLSAWAAPQQDELVESANGPVADGAAVGAAPADPVGLDPAGVDPVAGDPVGGDPAAAGPLAADVPDAGAAAVASEAAGSGETAGGAEPAGTIPPGWYPDPIDAGRTRWWSGTEWTDHQA